MEDLNDAISSSGFVPLFIKEEDTDQDRALMEQRACNTAQSELTFTGTLLNQSALIKPYLQEMDDLLKSCEELTGIPFSSRFSESYNETSLVESTLRPGKDEDGMQSYGGRSISPQAYLSTSYIDTHMDGAGTDNQQAQGQSQGLDTAINSCGLVSDAPRQREMPLTSVGNKLSDTMVEYEGQLLGMLAMLESCMEEAGMDFETQDWATDASQEYVHISKSSHLCKDTTQVPIKHERPGNYETQPMQVESWFRGEGVAQERRNEMALGLISQQNPRLNSNSIGDSSMETQELQGNLKTNKGILDSQFRFSEPSILFESSENYPMHPEVANTERVAANEGTHMEENATGIDVDNAELPDEDDQEPKMDTLGSGLSDLDVVGSQMDDCIEKVQHLEKRRRELLADVLELRGSKNIEEAEENNEEEAEASIDSQVLELMNALKKEEEGRRKERKREIQSLREERAEEERRLWKVNLERQGLQDEFRKLKRRLFAMARDCAHNQVALNNHHRDVELIKREEEKLQSLMLQLTEEVSQLRTAHQQQILYLQGELHTHSSSQTSNPQDELTQCRRHSCGDIQQYLQSGLKALEDRYEPVLLALLKRREVTAEALVKAKDQAQELRMQLGPLREEVQKLKLQRACLEEKLKLIQLQRREDIGQYKETVYCLEESSREFKMELKIQKRKTREMEELRDSLTNQLLLYRAVNEDHTCDDENA